MRVHYMEIKIYVAKQKSNLDKKTVCDTINELEQLGESIFY